MAFTDTDTYTDIDTNTDINMNMDMSMGMHNRWWGEVGRAKTPLDFLKIPFLLYFNIKILKHLNKF